MNCILYHSHQPLTYNRKHAEQHSAPHPSLSSVHKNNSQMWNIWIDKMNMNPECFYRFFWCYFSLYSYSKTISKPKCYMRWYTSPVWPISLNHEPNLLSSRCHRISPAPKLEVLWFTFIKSLLSIVASVASKYQPQYFCNLHGPYLPRLYRQNTKCFKSMFIPHSAHETQGNIVLYTWQYHMICIYKLFLLCTHASYVFPRVNIRDISSIYHQFW